MADNESNLTTGKSRFSGLSRDFVRTYKFFYGFLSLGLVFDLIEVVCAGNHTSYRANVRRLMLAARHNGQNSFRRVAGTG